MAFCQHCGTHMNDGVKYCPSCGAAVGGQSNTQQQNNTQSGFSETVQNLNNTPDSTAEFDRTDIEANKVMAVLAYLSWLVLIPIFVAPNSKFARYHANQGIVLLITEIIWWIIQGVTTAVLAAISWRLAFISTTLGFINLVFLLLAILGIINAANGKAKELPVIGKFRILK